MRVHLENLDVEADIRARDRTPNWSEYSLSFTRGIIDENLLRAMLGKSDLVARYNEYFKSAAPSLRVITSSSIIIRLYSTDLDVCSNFISEFLRWLDTEYFEEAKWKEAFDRKLKEKVGA